ncbi:uncharacterized protein C10orf67 homolog, mitochondrial isoform X2 [Clupea harengus]|uniref:Uncharacterized protein C10orf67 homolog, mitochondrial isoform X2 n=1 Tax=Clupea harengus TaxID=7950 RepID=A0A6P8F5F7_CLUHA|nr:uncharacterized protein C10orf67 homolog, mitochondrial isoform X2 [Clupea harengus]
MTMENNQLKVQLTNEKDAGRKKLNELKKGMEKEIDNIEAMRRKELLAAEETMEQQKQEQREMGMRHDALMSQKMAAAAKPTAVEDKTESTKPPSTLEKMEKLVAEQKTEIKRLKKDLRITIATWEKKFEILTKSFHAIKDEMFLRNNFQRQSAALHFASVSYTVR